jgi:hypothetical protein
MAGREHRRSLRVSCDSRVEIHDAIGGRGRVVDATYGGVGAELSRPAFEGDRLPVTIRLADRETRVIPRVARVDAHSLGRGGPFLVGCELEFADPVERREYIASLLRHARATGQGARPVQPGESIGRGAPRRTAQG